MAGNDIIEFLVGLLPSETTVKSNGEYTFNCRSCYRTERPDTKHRGGLKITSSGFIYHCFNCKYSCGYSIGGYISRKTKDFLVDLIGYENFVKFSDMAKALLDPDKKQEEEQEEPRIYRKVPESYISVRKCLTERISNEKIEKTLAYIANRNVHLIEWWDLMINPNMGEPHFLIPCYENGNVVGFSLRYANDHTDTRYLHYIPRGHIFNSDTFNLPRKFYLMCEGQLDAIALNCAGILGNEFKKSQLRWLKMISSTRNLVFVPDKDKAGSKIVEQIISEKLPISVSFPDWSAKDSFDAVKQYGRIKAVEMALQNIVSYDETVLLKVMVEQWN